MFENLYTTKMSMDKKKLQSRFSKIRSKNGRISKLIALIIFAVILLAMACVSLIIAANIKSDEYTMTENEFSDYINRPIGAVMADIDYADENKIIFHYGEGLFVINHQTGKIQFAMSIPKFNVSQAQQGSSILDVQINKGGKYAYLFSVGPVYEIQDYDNYIINLENGEVKKGTMPENTELFAGIADTFRTVQNPVGWYSNNCIVNSDKIYYLTSVTGTVNGMQLIIVHRGDGDIEPKQIFGNISVPTHSQIEIFSPDDIKDITNVELVVGGIQYPLAVPNAHTEIEKAFSTAEKIKMGGTGCPFNAELIFTRKDGKKGSVNIATDSCAVFFCDGKFYYKYGEDNAMLLGYFGLDENTVIDLTTIDKSYMDNAETVVRNFFAAFAVSDLITMKTLATNEFIAQGYIDDAYGICYGMTRATLETCSETNINEFLKHYSSKSKENRAVFSDNDIALLKSNSEEIKVYSVIVTAESNIKGEIKPPFKKFLNILCKRQNDGSWLVHKLES